LRGSSVDCDLQSEQKWPGVFTLTRQGTVTTRMLYTLPPTAQAHLMVKNAREGEIYAAGIRPRYSANTGRHL
jgi:hypothetical protein